MDRQMMQRFFQFGLLPRPMKVPTFWFVGLHRDGSAPKAERLVEEATMMRLL
jgi:hypothetical protein